MVGYIVLNHRERFQSANPLVSASLDQLNAPMKNLPIRISNHSYNGGDSIVAKIVLVTVQSVKVTIRVLENEFRQMDAAIQSIQVVKLNCLNFNPSPSIHSQVNAVHGKTCQECSLILHLEIHQPCILSDSMSERSYLYR